MFDILTGFGAIQIHFHPSFQFAGPAYEMMKKCDLKEKPDGLFNYFPTIHDAVHNAMHTMAPISVIADTS